MSSPFLPRQFLEASGPHVAVPPIGEFMKSSPGFFGTDHTDTVDDGFAELTFLPLGEPAAPSRLKLLGEQIQKVIGAELGDRREDAPLFGERTLLEVGSIEGMIEHAAGQLGSFQTYQYVERRGADLDVFVAE
jgi:hypothetical protein